MSAPRLPAFLGIIIGLIGAMLVLGYVSMRRAEALPPMLPDEGGPVRRVVMQYARGSDFVAGVFRQYLQYQSADVTVYMTCPEEADFAEIRGLIGDVKCKLAPVYTHHEMTAWSRDRWVAIEPPGGAGKVTLLSSKGELGAEVWPQRAGDSKVGEDLVRAMPDVFIARRSDLFFDGGDYLADGGNVFVTRNVLDRNLQHTVTTRDNLLLAVRHEVHLTPILMDDGPLHHAGMFMMSAGVDPQNPRQRVMMVADPSLGKKNYVASGETDAAFTGGPDFSAETQARFDSVAGLCSQNGYRVVRIPVVPAKAGKMYMTYVNVILDRSSTGSPIVYMSSYAGQEALNNAAAAVWSSVGYQVRPIDVSTVWDKGGTLHCLVNVFQRGDH